MVIVLPADGVWWFGAESDDAGQIDGTAHANEDFAAAQDRRARLYINDNNREQTQKKRIYIYRRNIYSINCETYIYGALMTNLNDVQLKTYARAYYTVTYR